MTESPTAPANAYLGYTDQSHLIREMNALVGDTPTGMLGQRLAPE